VEESQIRVKKFESNQGKKNRIRRCTVEIQSKNNFQNQTLKKKKKKKKATATTAVPARTGGVSVAGFL
jgi:hypothetical protein